MNKKIKVAFVIVLTAVCVLGLFQIPINAQAVEIDNPFEALEQVKGKISEAFEKMDKEKAEEIFSFLKEKAGDGAFDSEDGIKSALEQAQEKFEISIDPEDAQKIVETMEKLEDMGFSAEEIIKKTENLYQTYGADFVNHVEEVIAETVQKTVFTAVGSFFDSMLEGIGNFFKNLF